MSRIRKLALLATGATVLAAVGLVVFALVFLAAPQSGYEYRSSGDVLASVEGVPTSDPTRLRVMTWNIAYGYGKNSEAYAFVPRPAADFAARLERIAAVIKGISPDVVLLQEVDFHSSRSFDEDQLALLQRATGMAHAARAVGWSARYVPYPAWPIANQVGRVASGGAILSRFPITRHEVSYYDQSPANPFWYNAFNMRRYAQIAELDASGRALTVINNHLDSEDGVLRGMQVRRLLDVVKARSRGPIIVGGDLNTGLPDEPHVQVLRDSGVVQDVFVTRYGDAADRGYETCPTDTPLWRIDHLFTSDAWSLEDASVVSEAGEISDHFPVLAVLRW